MNPAPVCNPFVQILLALLRHSPGAATLQHVPARAVMAAAQTVTHATKLHFWASISAATCVENRLPESCLINPPRRRWKQELAPDTQGKNEVAHPQSNVLQVSAPLPSAFLHNLRPSGGKLVFKAISEGISEGKGREEWENSVLMQSGAGTA